MLELREIGFKLKGGSRTKILDQISLTIKPNALTVITGPNGSGKSTLAEIIMGIKTPTSGQVIYNQIDITKQSITNRAAQGIAYSFQSPVIFKGLTVYDLINIASGELIALEDAAKYLKKVGLTSDYLARDIDGKLSGGELKRIELASVLARHAKLIIFDEPEAGIDLWSFTKLVSVFKKLKSEGITTIIISHQERILKIADGIIILEEGKIKAKGTPIKLLPTITGVPHATK